MHSLFFIVQTWQEFINVINLLKKLTFGLVIFFYFICFVFNDFCCYVYYFLQCTSLGLVCYFSNFFKWKLAYFILDCVFKTKNLPFCLYTALATCLEFSYIYFIINQFKIFSNFPFALFLDPWVI